MDLVERQKLSVVCNPVTETIRINGLHNFSRDFTKELSENFAPQGKKLCSALTVNSSRLEPLLHVVSDRVNTVLSECIRPGTLSFIVGIKG